MNNANFKILPISGLHISSEVRSKLSLINHNIMLGSNDILETPILKSHGLDKILDLLDNMINSSELSTNLRNLENLNRSKFSPRSIASPWKVRKSGFEEYFYSKDNSEMIDHHLSPIKRLRPLSFDSALKSLKNNTNSGLPELKRKSIVKQSYNLNSFKSELSMEYPCVLFTRTQEGGKTRDIYGYPFSDTLREMMFYRPVLEYQKNNARWRSALLGPASVDKSVVDLLSRSEPDQYLISLDFKTFDRTVRGNLQKRSFDFIRNLYQTDFHNEIDVIERRFNNIPIVTPDGIYCGSHGVPSGSTFTNEIDSIAQFLVIMSTGFVDENDIQIQGDDGVCLIEAKHLDHFFESISKYGLIINKEKSYSSKDFVVYLQSLYDKYYINKGILGGIYPITRALNRILYQERWSDFESYGINGKDYYSLRTISILENCKYHPLFEKFVTMIGKLDKYSLEFSSDAVKKYSSMISNTEGSEGIIHNQYGDNIKGLAAFDTVRLLSNMR